MPKRGPCGHCGTNCTPLWRNGPKEKPVLCNACGSRWRLSGNLHNYVPHNGARTRSKKPKNNSTIITRNISKRRDGLRTESSSADPYYYYYSSDDSDFEALSNNTSSTSDSSSSSYCNTTSTRSTTSQSQISPVEGRDKPRLLPSISAVEKLQKDLYNIMVRLGSSFKSPDEDLLIYNLNNSQLDHHEIGLGGVLLQPPPTLCNAAPISV